MMEVLALFWSFVKIGFTSFGGFSMVPLINSEMISHGWMSAAEVSDVVAIAEMTPGPLGLNCATFAGVRAAGAPGAVAAALGLLSPTLTIGLVAAIFFEKWQKSRRMQQILTGVRPTVIGLLISVVVSLCMTNYVLPAGNVSPVLVGIGAVCTVCLLRFRWSVPAVIGLSALLGVLFVR